MTYDELLELALQRQNERDQWREVAMAWKGIAMERGKILDEIEEKLKKTLDPTVND